MAGAIVPLISALAPEVVNLVAALVHHSAPQAEMTHGPQTGPVKFANVFGSVMEQLQAAAAAGTISKSLPSDETVKVIIQAVVASMQLSGTLVPPSPASPASQTNWTISTATYKLGPGQSITINA